MEMSIEICSIFLLFDGFNTDTAFKCSHVWPFRSDSDSLIIGGVESVIFLSEVLLYTLLLKIMDFLQFVFCDEKLCG